MGVATAWSIGGAVAADFAAVGHDGLGRCAERHIEPVACLALGIAESMAPGIVGCTLLSLAAMLTAVGMSRTARAEPAPR